MDQTDASSQRVAGARQRHRLAAETQFAMIRAQVSDENLEQRRLAGAVLADDRVRLAVADREGDIAQRGDRAERLADLAKLDGRHA